MSRRFDNIERVSLNLLTNPHDNYVLIDSDQINKTGKTRLSDLIKYVSDRIDPQFILMSNGSLLGSSQGTGLRINV